MIRPFHRLAFDFIALVNDRIGGKKKETEGEGNDRDREKIGRGGQLQFIGAEYWCSGRRMLRSTRIYCQGNEKMHK